MDLIVKDQCVRLLGTSLLDLCAKDLCVGSVCKGPVCWVCFSRRPTQLQKNLFKLEVKKKVPKKKLPERDLPAKFFGEYLDPNENFSFFQTQ